ncbi:glycine--tRNA ligase [Patescibacteria group bacterium]|nr:glycine--tRNA ligase [Patescibacteria group bacterium]
MPNNDLMEKIVSLCKRRGFIFPGSEIYGGLANSWDYGPLGVEMKNNIKRLWWKKFVQQRDDMVGVDAALIMNPKVWQASGHLSNFNDPLIECKKCHSRFRADTFDADKCPNCGGKDFTPAKEFNLMFKTFMGPAEEEANIVYFRPETAQAMFVDFPNVLETSRKQLPFGIAQIGKAFRNEITPGNFIFRTREFEQMEIEYFIKPDEWEKQFEYWLGQMKEWVKAVGIDESKVHYVDIADADRAFYSKRTVDIEFDYPFGQRELYGLAYRTDFDLSSHQKASKQDLEYRDPETGEKFIPHVIEPSLGVDRTFLAVLLSAYSEVSGGRSTTTESIKDEEVVLRLPPEIAPIKAAVLPLSKKEELSKPARDLANALRKRWTVQYDETGSIGKRYRRQDEIGTPFCITYDFDTPNDKKVTVRDRDTMAQERVAIDDLETFLAKKLGN